MEWPDDLDIQALLGRGWRPAPFREFVLKVHSRCDLACDYCYVYRFADQRWRRLPRTMSPRIAEMAGARIAEHARAHVLDRVNVVLHGGEPLLCSTDDLTHTVNAVREAVGDGIRVSITVQTNGLRLDASYLRLFDRLGVTVGVSVDGDASAHDRHRRTPGGTGSHAAVARAVRRLGSPRFRHLFSGLLCVVDPRSDPAAVFEGLLDFEPPMIDFLLPHGHWSSPPPGRRVGDPGTPYADWLVEVFDRWYGTPGPQTRVRLFEGLLSLVLGGTSGVQGVGLDPVRIVVVETDGGIEQGDVLKTSRPGTPRSRLNIATDVFDRALLLPQIVAQQLGPEALAPECRACRLRRVCGGGQYAHRYREGSGFEHPSVYCPDLYRLISHIQQRIRADLRALRGDAG
ncbi:FxsB family cyclophane-forming radical SAM/SPASM peptide maturase [Streptosporangium sp. NPDC006007]|uniref:FxsB family cyclophane-forming radical SAM/SPASM peptide maturase n=1 Tax=Streptosporangium sp. NPDC006007 TaxID=3154575 RepID=UPI0033BA4928